MARRVVSVWCETPMGRRSRERRQGGEEVEIAHTDRKPRLIRKCQEFGKERGDGGIMRFLAAIISEIALFAGRNGVGETGRTTR